MIRPAASFNWLHFSDLRMGPSGSRLLDPAVREELERDLRGLAEVAGPWDLILLTGDLTETGAPAELAIVDTFLESLVDYLAELGPRPAVLAVPGGHDARERRSAEHAAEWRDPDRREALRATGSGGGSERFWPAVHAAFEPFVAWRNRWHAQTPALPWTSPRVPGDFARVVERGGRRLVVLGLNSAYAQLAPGEWEGLLDVDTDYARQVLEASPGDPCLLLTHHPSPWLLPDARHRLADLLRGRTVLRLSGHAARTEVVTPDRDAPAFGALSLFGVPGAEAWFGYAAGRADLDARAFGIWPRRFFINASGAFVAGMDRGRFFLAPDGAVTLPWDADIDDTLELALLSPRAAPAPKVVVGPPPQPPPPEGLTLRRTLGAGLEPVVWLAWSPDGARLASGHADGTLAVWDPVAGSLVRSAKEHAGPVLDLAWSPDGSRLASISDDALLLWDAELRRHKGVRAPAEQGGDALAWRAGGRLLAWRSRDGTLWSYSVATPLIRQLSEGRVSAPVLIKQLGTGRVHALAFSPDGAHLAVAPFGKGLLELWDGAVVYREMRLDGGAAPVLDLAWTRDARLLAAAYEDGSVVVWDPLADRAASDRRAPIAVLTSHAAAVTSLSFSPDGRLLATKSHDGTVKLWRTDTWSTLGTLPEAASRHFFSGLAFAPSAPVLATLGSWNIRLWDVDEAALLGASSAPATAHTVRAKVVIVGEGSAGKSCLALRLAEGRYAELGATHGMRFWPIPAERLDPVAAPAGEEREVVLWDLGGQSEYQLVHQLFLGDTTVALLVFEPRRGSAALDELEGWLKRLEKIEARSPTRKILVGTKLDDDRAPVDRAAIDAFVRRHGIDGYVATSAREGTGIDALQAAIGAGIRWDELGRTSEEALFRSIRRSIEAQAAAGRVVLPLSELDLAMRAEDPEAADPEAVRAVVRQLALQGALADTRLADGTRALVLQIEQLDRYASSLVLLARDNPRGVPAIDLATLLSPSLKLPRLAAADRLRRDQELPILDCVTELLLEHGVALRHEGLLVFPSLFRPTEHDPAFPHAVALYYEFSGAVDNIYASLVTSLAVSRQFGPLRLWESRAEFSRAGQGTAGVRRSQRDDGARGIARLDVYFDAEAAAPTRELFVGVVEELLRERDVDILEQLTITCTCGEVLPETAVRRRLERGLPDIPCPACEARWPLTPSAAEARDRSPDLAHRLRALRTIMADQKRQTVTGTKVELSSLQRAQSQGAAARPIRILHLSDLHVRADADPQALLQPLAVDLEDRVDGLGVDALDLLVISGDVTNRASPSELEKARELVSGIIERFKLTAERCVLVPGNHDLDWNEPVYDMVKKRAADPAQLVPGRYKEQGDYYEVRDEARYPNRFKSFSKYFYHPLLQRPYALPFADQAASILDAELGLQILALNSAWEIDEYFPARAGIHPGALARGLDRAERELAAARREGRIAEGAPVLRLAVWHHPVSGNEKIVDDAFMGSLQRAGVRLCLHGHVHEDRADLFGYLHPTRRIHVVGAGSFGAPAADRPESAPCLYNLVEVSRDLATVRVHTRGRRRPTGAWEGWAVWPSPTPGERRTFYEVKLDEPA